MRPGAHGEQASAWLAPSTRRQERVGPSLRAGILPPAIDISNPASPAIVGNLDTPSEARDVVVSGTHAYVANLTSGLRVIDISNPQSPHTVGSVPTTLALGVARSGTYA